MSVKRSKHGRRFFLRGAAATVIGLPLLECMLDGNGEAYADGEELPCRFLLYFCPTSLVGSGGSFDDDRFIPNSTGPGYDLKTCLEPLGERNIQGDVSAISGLFAAPFDAPGGYDADYHGLGPDALVTGQRHGWVEPTWRPLAPSADILVAEALGNESLVFQIDGEPATYSPSIFQREDGTYWYTEAQRSPAAAYRSLVTSLVPDEPDPALDLERRIRLSSLSFASEQISSLNGRLGVADRRRLDEHLTSIRSLETRLEAGGGPVGMACMDPGSIADPPDISGTVPDQAARATLFNELATLAVACNITQSIVISGTGNLTGSGMRHALWDSTGGLHADVQHSSSQDELSAANRWFVDQYADLVQRLKGIDEMGTTALDRSAVVFLTEGGKGGREADGGGDVNHSTDNMIMLLAGRAGGLEPGQHVVAPADMHPAAILNTAMQAIGVDERLGEIEATLPALFTA